MGVSVIEVAFTKLYPQRRACTHEVHTHSRAVLREFERVLAEPSSGPFALCPLDDMYEVDIVLRSGEVVHLGILQGMAVQGGAGRRVGSRPWRLLEAELAASRKTGHLDAA